MDLQEYLQLIENKFEKISHEYVFSKLNSELCKKGNYYLITVCDEKYLTDINFITESMMIYEFIVIPYDKETYNFKNENVKIFYYKNDESKTHTSFELSVELSCLVRELLCKYHVISEFGAGFGQTIFRTKNNKLKQHYPHCDEFQNNEDNFIHHIHQSIGLVEEENNPECFAFYNKLKLFPIIKTDNEIKYENERFIYAVEHIILAGRMKHSPYTHQTVYVQNPKRF
jgi:hypothetical protein